MITHITRLTCDYCDDEAYESHHPGWRKEQALQSALREATEDLGWHASSWQTIDHRMGYTLRCPACVQAQAEDDYE